MQCEDGFVDHRHQNPICHETRVVVHLHRHLAQLCTQRHDLLADGVAGRIATDDFDELHHRHRIHEVHSNHFVRTLGRRGNLRDGNGACVCGQNAPFWRRSIEVCKNLELELGVFGGGFHHQFCLGHCRAEVRGGGQARERTVLVRAGNPLLGDHSVQILANGAHGAFKRIGGTVHQNDVVASLCKDMGDPVAHGSRPNDRHLHAHTLPFLVAFAAGFFPAEVLGFALLAAFDAAAFFLAAGFFFFSASSFSAGSASSNGKAD